MNSLNPCREHPETRHPHTEALERRARTGDRQRCWWRGLAGALFARGLRRSRNGSRDQRPRHTLGLVSILAMSLVVGWITSAAGQAINCGDTLGPGGIFQLQADLVCGDVSPALTVRDRAQVDLSGHAIVGSGPGEVVVLLDGQGAVLRNGSVRSDQPVRGISVAGSGGHIVLDVDASALSTGITVSSDRNRLLRNTAIESELGFSIQGSENLLVGNVGSGQGGFTVTGTANLLFQNAISGVRAFGFAIVGDNNQLVSNTALSDNDQGSFIIAGDRNRVDGNVASNGNAGISVSGQENVMVGNTALENRTDLVDTHEDCDTNLWQQNIFLTSLAGSIEKPACIQ